MINRRRPAKVNSKKTLLTAFYEFPPHMHAVCRSFLVVETCLAVFSVCFRSFSSSLVSGIARDGFEAGSFDVDRL